MLRTKISTLRDLLNTVITPSYHRMGHDHDITMDTYVAANNKTVKVRIKVDDLDLSEVDEYGYVSAEVDFYTLGKNITGAGLAALLSNQLNYMTRGKLEVQSFLAELMTRTHRHTQAVVIAFLFNLLIGYGVLTVKGVTTDPRNAFWAGVCKRLRTWAFENDLIAFEDDLSYNSPI